MLPEKSPGHTLPLHQTESQTLARAASAAEADRTRGVAWVVPDRVFGGGAERWEMIGTHWHRILARCLGRFRKAGGWKGACGAHKLWFGGPDHALRVLDASRLEAEANVPGLHDDSFWVD